MIRTVFIDTAAWISIIDADDSLHATAKAILHQLNRQKARLITTEFVLLEVADAFCKPRTRGIVIAYLDGLRRMSHLKVVPLSQSLLLESWDLYRRRPDKGWGLTDCTSFIVMELEQISEVFTSDRHFEQAGFTKLL
ncbi:MAG: type II toxin-antitoxin system VapC family toxin [Blastocatellales bacterium]